MTITRRSAWTTRANAATIREGKRYAGVAVHWPAAPWTLEGKPHAECLIRLRAIEDEQVGRKPPDNYAAIAYQAVVCLHGDLIEGRTVNRVNAANGSADNITLGSVLALLGMDDTPTPAMLHGLESSLDYLNSAPRLVPHSQLKPTACPGPALTRWLRAATNPGDTMDWTDKIKMTPATVRDLDTAETVEVRVILSQVLRDARLGRYAAVRAEAYAKAAAERAGLTEADLDAIASTVETALEAGVDVEVTVGGQA